VSTQEQIIEATRRYFDLERDVKIARQQLNERLKDDKEDVARKMNELGQGDLFETDNEE